MRAEFHDNISLNPTITENMIIHHTGRRKKGECLLQFYINHEKITQVDGAEYLGVIVDDTLSLLSTE